MVMRRIVQLILLCVLIGYVKNGIEKLLSGKKTVSIDFQKDQLPLPSVSICPREVREDYIDTFLDKNMTLSELWNSTASMVEHVVLATVFIGNEYHKGYRYL